jgi:hypothetical protein
MDELGKYLVGLGIVIVIVGLILLMANQVSFLGKLPGDISIQTENVSCFFPLASSIVISLVLTVVLNIILRIMNK